MGEVLRVGVRKGIEKVGLSAIPLNDLVSYYQLSKDHISIHVSGVDLSLAEKRRQMHDGLQELARSLTVEPNLSEVNVITATSWIVGEYPKIIENLGFTVDTGLEHPLARTSIRRYKSRSLVNIERKYKDKRPGFAWMGRVEFLQRYADDSSKHPL